MNNETKRRIAWVGVAVVVLLVALWTRTRELNAPDFWRDEAYSLYHLRSGTTSGLITSIARNEESPPLYFILLAAWSALGRGEFFARAPSALIGVLAVAASLRIGRFVSGREAGWLAGLLMAVSYLAVILSRQIRPYALGLLWVEMILWITIRLIVRGNWRDALLWALVSALGLFTNYLIALTIASAWLSVLWFGRRRVVWKHLAVMAAGVGVAAASLLPMIRAQAAWSLPTLVRAPPLSLRLILQTIDMLTLGIGTRQGPPIVAVSIIVSLVALILLASYRLVKQAGARRAIVLILFLPLVVSYLVSLRQPIFYSRYLFMAMPLLCLVLAHSITLVTARWRQIVSAVIGMGLLGLSAGPYSFNDGVPWSAVAARVAAQAREGEGIIFAPLDDRLPFESKYHGPSLRAVGVLDYADYVARTGQVPFAVTAADVNEYFGGDASFWIVEDAGWPVGDLPGWRVSEQYAYPGATLRRLQKASP